MRYAALLSVVALLSPGGCSGDYHWHISAGAGAHHSSGAHGQSSHVHGGLTVVVKSHLLQYGGTLIGTTRPGVEEAWVLLLVGDALLAAAPVDPASGFFGFANVPPGFYTLVLEAAGEERARLDGVEVVPLEETTAPPMGFSE